MRQSGTIWSSSPCMINVGRSKPLRSAVKSVSENALMQSMTALKPACIPWARTSPAYPARALCPAGSRHRTARGEILEELRSVGHDAGTNRVERRHRQAARIGRGLQHQRRHRADQHGLGDPLRAVATDIAGDFAAPGGVSDMDGVLQVERFAASVARSSA